MESGLLEGIGIDPAYLLIIMFVIQIILFIFLIRINQKYNRLKNSYMKFMEGKDGENLEKGFFEKFRRLEEVEAITKRNETDISSIKKKLQKNYQKVGIVKYDAFHETGGNLSFALTMLDDQNNGWILNAMHTREGCYTYIKEIVRGESYVELGEEEEESLEHAIFQEAYDIKDVELKEKKKRIK